MAEDSSKPAYAREIDENLKRVFQEKLDEDIPDRFADLLSKLNAQSGTKRAEDSK